MKYARIAASRLKIKHDQTLLGDALADELELLSRQVRSPCMPVSVTGRGVRPAEHPRCRAGRSQETHWPRDPGNKPCATGWDSAAQGMAAPRFFQEQLESRNKQVSQAINQKQKLEREMLALQTRYQVHLRQPHQQMTQAPPPTAPQHSIRCAYCVPTSIRFHAQDQVVATQLKQKQLDAAIKELDELRAEAREHLQTITGQRDAATAELETARKELGKLREQRLAPRWAPAA